VSFSVHLRGRPASDDHANVAWGGGPKRNVLYICGTTSLYSVRLMVNGAKTV